ncbi:hypothetical protein ASZ90_010620 [hydrocarbon metagenome]|uniref:Uncharacterized protein n=1 Tax=hydrocarbon metagenome TaxID=938273 RepID=A0A0W8FG59_9ZZZZ
MAALITFAFGLVAALAWNEAIQALFALYIDPGGSITAMLIYAVLVTIIAVLATIWIGSVAARARSAPPAEPR